MRLECFTIGEWIGEFVPARPDREWMDQFADRHAYRCLPLAIANSYGWQILSPCQVDIEFNGGTRQDDLKVTSPDGPTPLDAVAKSNFSRGIVTLHTGYLFRTSPDWQLIATGPFNAPKDGLTPLTGVIETNWLPYPFTMNWQVTRPGTYSFAKGEPICHILPVPIGALDEVVPEIHRLTDDPELLAEHEAFRGKREEFMKRFRAGDPETLKQAWQRFYFRGQLPSGRKAPATHTNKLRLAAPVDRRGVPTSRERIPQDMDQPSTPQEAAVQPDPIATAGAAQPTEPRRIPTYRAIQRQADTDAILYHEGLLTPEQCRILMDTFERHHNLTAPNQDKFFDSRVIWMTSLPREAVEALRIMQQARYVACHLVGRFFRHERPLYDDAPQLVKWPTGFAMPVHADNQHPDGSANGTPHRLYAGVVYLNDNFKGGMLYLDKLEVAIVPKPGLLIGFRGDGTHTHGVSKVMAGERYTMPMWFTDDISRADRSLFKVF
ncbi:MAG: DUF6065 family protein [Geminicoccaceae bacterium]